MKPETQILSPQRRGKLNRAISDVLDMKGQERRKEQD